MVASELRRVLIGQSLYLGFLCSQNKEAEALINVLENSLIQAFVTRHSHNIFLYQLSILKGEKISKETKIESINVIDIQDTYFNRASQLKLVNLESGIEVACAEGLNIEAIVTDKPKDFEGEKTFEPQVLTVGTFIVHLGLEKAFLSSKTSKTDELAIAGSWFLEFFSDYKLISLFQDYWTQWDRWVKQNSQFNQPSYIPPDTQTFSLVHSRENWQQLLLAMLQALHNSLVCECNNLESGFRQLKTELETLEQEVTVFRDLYNREIARRTAQVSYLQAKVAEEELNLSPNDQSLRERFREIYQEAKVNHEEYYGADSWEAFWKGTITTHDFSWKDESPVSLDDMEVNNIPDAFLHRKFKALFRQASRLFHPNNFPNLPDEQKRRYSWWLRVLKIKEEPQIERRIEYLRSLIEAWEFNEDPPESCFEDKLERAFSDIERLKRKVVFFKNQTKLAHSKIKVIRNTELYKLMVECESSTKLFSRLVDELEKEINEEQRRLHRIRGVKHLNDDLSQLLKMTATDFSQKLNQIKNKRYIEHYTNLREVLDSLDNSDYLRNYSIEELRISEKTKIVNYLTAKAMELIEKHEHFNQSPILA